ncbi:MAG: Rrf2 family transcriptional regulator [Bryobacterales bacterium]|nr:Rrf2 family transcriptional regulator [Bryobacterales bacterium]
MKFTSHEEYGLRCLLRVARMEGTATIGAVSQAEGISEAYVAKLLRILRIGGFVTSVRGMAGGYVLSRAAQEIVVGDVLTVLGGRLFEDDFCERHSGTVRDCTNTVDCAVRALWGRVQYSVDQVLSRTTLRDLVGETLPVKDELVAVTVLSAPAL